MAYRAGGGRENRNIWDKLLGGRKTKHILDSGRIILCFQTGNFDETQTKESRLHIFVKTGKG